MSVETAQEILAINDKEKLLLGTLNAHETNVAREAVNIRQMWQKIGRQTLSMHPVIVDAVRTATADKVDGSVLLALPYISPMVVYPGRPTLPLYGDWAANQDVASMECLGFFVFGADKRRLLHTTTEPNVVSIGITVFCVVRNHSGDVVDYEVNNIIIPCDDMLDIDDFVSDVQKRFTFSHVNGQVNSDPYSNKFLSQLVRLCLGSLLYLASTVIDADKVPASAVRRACGGKSGRKSPLSLTNIGWTTGAAVSRYRAAQRPRSDHPTHTGIEQDPQHRRAHFKMQAYGPGRAFRKLLFVAPYWTKKELLGEYGMNTMRSVRKD